MESQVKAAVDSTSIGALAEDFFGPVLESATVNPTTAAVGETITITAKVTDDLSGVAAVDAYLNLPNGNGYKILPLELDTATGEWKGTYTITELDLEGTWIIDFDLFDAAGNYTYALPTEPIEVQVVNPNGGDVEAPTLESRTITPLAVGINEEVTIRAKVNDANGVDSVFAAIYTADSTGYHYVPLTFDEVTGEWVGSHTFSESDQSGSWYIDIDMFDKAGNFDWVTLEEELVLTNPLSDYTNPTIGEPVITTKTASPGESVRVSVPVNDDQSGVSSVYAEFSHIDHPNDIYLRHMTLDPNTGEWVVDFDIESGFQSGVWNLVIHSTDNAGNSGFKEYPAAFDVINNDGDFEAPVISNVQVTQGEVQVGETVTVTANVTDNVALDSVFATFYSQEGSQFVEMSYDEATDQWTGSFEVQETTAPGFYQVSVAAYDTSFNLNFGDAEGGFTVVNPVGDYTGPVISTVELDKTEVNAGEQITISATVEDTESGVATVIAHYYDNETIELTYDSTLGKWVGTITVPANVPDGQDVKVNYIDAVDQTGNQTVQFIDGVSFLVHNPDGDFTAPVVDSLVMTPSIVKPGETVHFEAKLGDDKSGVKSAIVDLYNSSNPEITSIDLTYDEANDVWKADYVIPANPVLGSYSVSLEVGDNAGNIANHLQTQTLRVVDENADITAPDAPTVSEVSDQSTEVSGTTEAGASVTVSIGSETYNGTADETGNFTITIPAQTAGTVITVTAKDDSDNVSEETKVTVVDKTAPALPVVAEVSDQSTAVSGTTEAGASIIVSIGSETYTGTADETGNFTITIPVQTAGTVITVTAKDAADNASEETTVTVVDKTPPAAPKVENVTDKTTVITGTTEIKSIVTAKIGDTNYTGTSYSNGVYKITIPTQNTGTIITLTAADEAGNVSTETNVTVGDATAPGVPKVNFVTDAQTSVTGETEAGAAVTVTIGSETYTGSANETGVYSVTIPMQSAGTVISVKATDTAGNTGNPRSVTVLDRTAPATPKVNYVSDKATVVTGQVEAGATVTVTIGTETYSGTADPDGAFQVTIPVQPAGTRVHVRAVDAAGNKSNLRTVIVVDKTAPSAPTVNEVGDNATLVTGTTEGGANITVTIGTETYTGRAFSNGTFRVSIPAQPAGTRILVRATDAGGNKSTLSSVIVVDKTPPAIPTIDPLTAGSTTVRGTTEGGAYITVTIGSQSYTARAFSNGTFRVSIPAQTAGTKVSVSATDAKGNMSKTSTITVTE